jgi:nicotinate-nucleotide adenylyltransferase
MGGSFDPIHLGHLAAAEWARVQLALHGVLFVPAGTPPHKEREMTPGETRFEMVLVATAGHPQFWVSRRELESPGVDYTVDTLEGLAADLAADARLFFIAGSDAVLDILSWRNPSRILELCTLVAVTRPGYDAEALGPVLRQLPGGDHTVVLPSANLEISSSMVRERLAAGSSVRYLIPDAVVALIEKQGLYRGPRG